MAVPNGHADPKAHDLQRPLIIQLGKNRVSLFSGRAVCAYFETRTSFSSQFSVPVDASGDVWVAAEVLRDEFVHSQKDVDAVETTSDLEDASQATVELFARFLAFVADNLSTDDRLAEARTEVLLFAIQAFTDAYLTTKDVHSLTTSFDVDVRKTVLSSYFRALAVLEERQVSGIPRCPPSALLSASDEGSISAYALFGGQGTNEVYFDELQNLYDIYKPYVTPFITMLTINILQPLAIASASPYYAYGLEVLSWLSGALPRPPTDYFASVPVSFPLIGLTQLTQYLVACRVLNVTPGELRSRLQGATGHSQGIVSAVCIAASDSQESFFENAGKALRWLFFCGLRGQEAFPVLAVEPGIVSDLIEGGEGNPSPMLSVSGLPLKELEPHIAKTNNYLPENSKLYVSLHNGPKTFVITGPPKSLYGLVASLRKVRAAPGLDQSKIPFSQRKPVFSARFLVVGVPYHSDYLNGVTDKVMKDLNEELWRPEDISIPVFNTEDGEHIQHLQRSDC